MKIEQNLNPFWKKRGDNRVFCILHRVRYSDTDKMNMVYHGSYIPMLEAARVDTLREIGWVYAEMERNGILLPVINLELKFKKPARYDQILRIETCVASSPTSRLHFKFRIMHDEDILVEANVSLAFIDSNSGRPSRAPVGLDIDLKKNRLIH